MSAEPALVATPSQTVGPFFGFALTADARLGTMIEADAPGEHIRLRVRVTDGAAQAVTDAIVELWQAVPASAAARFGRLPTGEDGACEFETVRPVRLPDARGGWHAAHINVCLFARGLLRHIYTRLYFAGDPDLTDDALLGLVPEDRRETLLAHPDGADGRWLFEVRLHGDRETVFFEA